MYFMGIKNHIFFWLVWLCPQSCSSSLDKNAPPTYHKDKGKKREEHDGGHGSHGLAGALDGSHCDSHSAAIHIDPKHSQLVQTLNDGHSGSYSTAIIHMSPKHP
jgi:hypothetical protein